MSLLPPEALYLGDGQAADADLGQSLADLVELEWLDDSFDLFHECSGINAGLLQRRLHHGRFRGQRASYSAHTELIG